MQDLMRGVKVSMFIIGKKLMWVQEDNFIFLEEDTLNISSRFYIIN